jgi:hypothetical protein
MKSNSFPPGFAGQLNNLSIDFDGVIHDDYLGYHDGTCYGLPIEGSLDALRMLSKQYKIIIFTAKSKKDRPLVNGKTGTELVWEWLKAHGVDDCVAEVTSEKPRSFLYIDDNGYRFLNWKDTLDYVSVNHADKGK